MWAAFCFLQKFHIVHRASSFVAILAWYGARGREHRAPGPCHKMRRVRLGRIFRVIVPSIRRPA